MSNGFSFKIWLGLNVPSMIFNFGFLFLSIKRTWYFTFLIGTLSLSSCIKREPAAINEIKFDDEIAFVQLENWQFFGPFYQDSTEIIDPIEVDFLNHESKIKETDIDKNGLLAIAKSHPTIQSGLVKTKVTGVNILDYIEKKRGAVYLFCTIKSRSDQDINFIFSGMQNAKLWLNNEFVYESEWKRIQFKYYEEYLPVKLKKGNNFLLLKVGLSDAGSSVTNWKFNFYASTNNYAKSNYLKDYKFSILNESIVDTSVVAYLGPFINEEIDYKIFDDDSTLIVHSSAGNRDNKKGLISLGVDSLIKDKLYKIDFNIGNENISQDFYYGDFNAIFNEISGQYIAASNSDISDKDKLNIEASYKRLQFVKTQDFEPETLTSLKAYWDRSRILFAKELSDFFKGNFTNDSNQGNRFNGFIKSYISNIDNSKQYYSSYIPKKLKQQNKKIPLVIISPFTYFTIPYLEYWSISNLEQIMWDYKLAEDYGFGVIRINLRGHPGLNEIGMTAFQEILRDVKSNNNVDEDRIFILGNSVSSRMALSLATQFPSVFAGCVLYNPDIDIQLMNGKGYQLENMSNSGLYMQHSIKDELIPMENVEFIYEKMKTHSKGPIFKVVDDNTHYIAAKDSYRNAFEYIKDKKRNSKPKDIVLSTSELKYGESYGLRILEKQQDGIAKIKVSFDEDTIQINSQNVSRFELDLEGRRIGIPIKLNGNLLNKTPIEGGKLNVLIGGKSGIFPFTKSNLVEGPINHAFASNFKIVYNKKDQAVKDTLNQLWKSVYFNNVLSLRDTDVAEKDIDNSNLILIGNKFDNKAIQSIVDQLPIKIYEDYILFRDRRFTGKNVFISFVYPNPTNPEKYIVLVASNSKLENIPIKDFSNDGKYDFMVFNSMDDKYELSSWGHFDNNWQ